MARKRARAKKAAAKSKARKPKKSAVKSGSSRAKKLLRGKKAAGARRPALKGKSGRHGGATGRRGRADDLREPLMPRGRGLGPDAGGQSGDVQGLRGTPFGDSESVEELVEDGQAYEAEVISGVEDAPDPDQGEVRTREVVEDDVPPEYLENQ
ncbi:MAG TPA: hypothetical protein VMJ93_16250 [Verrucomicrobiae bacterium]|nr:hypothetical protein [Verrucomicrobiae bacterium]